MGVTDPSHSPAIHESVTGFLGSHGVNSGFLD